MDSQVNLGLNLGLNPRLIWINSGLKPQLNPEQLWSASRQSLGDPGVNPRLSHPGGNPERLRSEPHEAPEGQGASQPQGSEPDRTLPLRMRCARTRSLWICLPLAGDRPRCRSPMLEAPAAPGRRASAARDPLPWGPGRRSPWCWASLVAGRTGRRTQECCILAP